jgi:hypothetical protein
MTVLSVSSPGWLTASFTDQWAIGQWLKTIGAASAVPSVVEVRYVDGEGATIWTVDDWEPLRFPLAAPPPAGAWARLTEHPETREQRHRDADIEWRDHYAVDPEDR